MAKAQSHKSAQMIKRMARSSPVPSQPPLSHSKALNARTASKRAVLFKEVQIDNEDQNTTAKHNIFGGSDYSKALLTGNESPTALISRGETSYHQIESLQFLEGTQNLFFRKCKTFPPELSSFNPKNKRGIWNSSGRVVYYTGEKETYTCRGCHYSGFIQEVVDYTGKLVLTASGRQLIFGLNSHIEIYLEGKRLLGTMNQSCLSSTYEIKDCTGRLIYKIQAPCFAPCAPFVFWCCKEHFEICMDDGVSEIGKITKYWDSSIFEFQSCVGIEMDRADDVRVKALLLGCFFLIEFQYYRGAGNGLVYFILMIILFAGIVAATECVGYCPFWLDDFIGNRRVKVV